MVDNTATLAVFPLGTVLLPGMVMPLRIFEPRYKRMLRDCEEQRSGFGINLILRGQEVGGGAEPYAIGTAARVLDQRPLREDQLLVMVSGERRYRILKITQQEPYLKADVEWLEDDDAALGTAEGELATLMMLGKRLIEISAEANEDEAEVLPDGVAKLSWFLAARLPLDSEGRQALLEMTSLGDRVRKVANALREAIPEFEKKMGAMRRARELRQRNGKLASLVDEE